MIGLCKGFEFRGPVCMYIYRGVHNRTLSGLDLSLSKSNSKNCNALHQATDTAKAFICPRLVCNVMWNKRDCSDADGVKTNDALCRSGLKET